MHGYFHHSRGGFPLDSVSYQLVPCGKPTIGTLEDIDRDMQVDPRYAKLPTEERRRKAREAHERMEANMPAAHAAYDLVPYRVEVYHGEKRLAHLYFVDVVRFLRAVGVLTRCGRCNVEQLIPDQAEGDRFPVCDDCRRKNEAYRSS